MGLRRFRVLSEQIAQRIPEKRLNHIEFSVRDRQTGKIVHDREVQRLAGDGSNGFATDSSHAAVIAPAAPSVLARDWSADHWLAKT
jgi:hypothetical protein